jgi:thiamine biosynthesis protein ThiC
MRLAQKSAALSDEQADRPTPSADAVIEGAWTTEIAARVAELRAGRAELVPFDESLAAARRRIAARRRA